MNSQFEMTYLAVSQIAQGTARLIAKNEKIRKEIENIISHFKA